MLVELDDVLKWLRVYSSKYVYKEMREIDTGDPDDRYIECEYNEADLIRDLKEHFDPDKRSWLEQNLFGIEGK